MERREKATFLGFLCLGLRFSPIMTTTMVLRGVLLSNGASLSGLDMAMETSFPFFWSLAFVIKKSIEKAGSFKRTRSRVYQ